MPVPTLTTDRLTLSAFTLSDAPEVTRLAGDRAIADTTMNIPHPYSGDDALGWIGTHEKRWEEGTFATFAVRGKDGTLLGAAGLVIAPAMERAELGYWVGREHWNRGHATEAARAVLAYGFEELTLRRIHARYLTRNPASGRALAKIGMKPEGVLRRHILKWGVPEDIALVGLLREEFRDRSGSPGDSPGSTAR